MKKAKSKSQMAREYYLSNRDKILKQAREYNFRPDIIARRKVYRHQYYQKNRELLLKKCKDYMKRPEVVSHQKSSEVRKRLREHWKKYRESPRGKLKIAEYNKKRRQMNPDYWKKRYKKKRKEIREKQKVYERTPHAKELKRKYESRSDRKAKKSDYTKAYQARPKVHKKRLAQSRVYRKTPKGRLNAQYYNERRRTRKLKAPGSHTKEQWIELRNATGGVCPLCGRKVGIDKMSMDHIIPISKGGSNDISNIRAICKNCNSAIGNRPYMYMINPDTGKRERVFV